MSQGWGPPPGGGGGGGWGPPGGGPPQGGPPQGGPQQGGPPQQGGYGPPPGQGGPPQGPPDAGGYGPPPGQGGPPQQGGYGPPPGQGGPPQQGGYGPPQGGPPQGYGGPPPGQQMQYAGPPMGAIEIKTGFFFLQWILYLFDTRIEINGVVQQRPWGTHVFPVPAGGYNIRVWFPYMLMSQCGMSSLQVPVNPGAVTVLEYSAPFILFLGGTLTPRGMKPMMGMAPY